MLANPPLHPAPEQLAAYGLGKLDTTQSGAVSEHLEVCEDCRRTVAETPSDTFLEILRTARPKSPAPAAAPAVAAASLPPSPAAQGTLALPPELAEHGRFRILAELGRGGMGVVYKAEHKLMERHVAIKVISKTLLDHPQALERFHREVRAAARLDHPNIVRAYDAEQAGDLHTLVMEYVDGLDLSKVLERKGPLPIPHSCHYIRQAALGLQHAFEMGMVHRDLKPQNLMLIPNKGTVKILDFGLARLASEQQHGPGLTAQNAVMGTPEYMAPEQATDARTADIRADIYSLGCTLYTLLTGRTPFQEETAVKMILAHLDQEAPPLHERRPEVSRELSAVVAKMMAKEPGQRYQTPKEVAEALAGFCNQGAKAVPAATSGPQPAAVVSTGPLCTTDINPVPKVRSEAVSQPLMAKPVGDVPLAAPVQASPWEELTKDVAVAPSVKKRDQTQPESGGGERRSSRWAWIAGAAALLLIVAVSGIVVKIRISDGILVIEVNEPDAEVFVDGAKVIVKWGNGGKTAEFRIQPGKRNVEVKKDGFKVFGQAVEIEQGGRILIAARLELLTTASGGAGKPDNRQVPPPAPSSLDKLDPSKIPAEERFAWQPKELVAVLGEHRGRSWHYLTRCIAFSPDGTLMATGGHDNAVRLWDSATLREQAVLLGHTDRVNGLAFLPHGKTLVTASQDRTVRLWDLGDSRPKSGPILAGHKGPIISLSLSADGNTLATGSEDGTVRLWDLNGQQPKQHLVLDGQMKAVYCVALAPNVSALAWGGADGMVHLCELNANQPITQAQVLAHKNQVVGLAFSPDGRTLASAGGIEGSRNVRLWLLEPGGLKIHAALGGHQGWVNSVVFSLDGKTLASCGEDRTVRLWNVTTEMPTELEVLQYGSAARCAAFAPGGKKLAACGGTLLRVWDLTEPTTRELLEAHGHTSSVWPIAFAPDGRTLASGSMDTTVRLWDVSQSKPHEKALLSEGLSTLKAVAFSPNGKTVAVGTDWIPIVHLWSLDGSLPKKRGELRGHHAGITCLAFSADGSTLASGSFDQTVCLWDMTGLHPQVKHVLRGHKDWVRAVTFSPDGKRLVSASNDKTIRVWNLDKTESPEQVLTGHTGPVISLSITSDGNTVASGGSDGTVLIWDLSQEKLKVSLPLRGHTGEVTGVAMTRDGKTLVSADWHGRLILWSLPERRAVREWVIPGGAFYGLALAPDGRHIATGNGNGTVYILRIN